MQRKGRTAGREQFSKDCGGKGGLLRDKILEGMRREGGLLGEVVWLGLRRQGSTVGREQFSKDCGGIGGLLGKNILKKTQEESENC